MSALNPEIMGLGPIEASRQALARAGKTIDEIDLVEINEAFAAQVIPSAKELGIPTEKLNLHGGAIALGHPFGMTGARIMTTLLNGLEDTGGTIGLESMCIGGGGCRTLPRSGGAGQLPCCMAVTTFSVFDRSPPGTTSPSAVVVMSDTRAQQLGLTPLARIVSSGVSGLDPEIMGLGPIEAIRQALKRAGMTIDDIDLVEINEAFAAQVVPSAKHLNIPIEKLNVNGGGIALGHPFGMTGARIMTTLLNGLEDSGGRYGLESMCVGGGQGMAMVIERIS